MSAKLAKEIGLSVLAPGLKFTAVMMALHGDDDGNSIRPSVARIARMTGKTDRQVRRDIAELCRLNVLIPLTKRIGGGGAKRATLYKLNVEGLPPVGNEDMGVRVSRENSDMDDRDEPANPDMDDRDRDATPDTDDRVLAFHDSRDSSNPDIHVRVSTSIDMDDDQKPGHLKPKTRTSMSGDRIDRNTYVRTTAQTPRFLQQSKQPNGTNYRPIAKLVRLLLESNPSFANTDRYAELVEAAKQRCADLRIDYGRHELVPFNVVHRACASELMKFNLFGTKVAAPAATRR